MEEIKDCYLIYDFTYEGVRHRGKITLVEDWHGVQMLFDNHALEITWEKRIRHKGKDMTINIVVDDDWNNLDTLGRVVASAWVRVYDKSRRLIVDEFEPDNWSYIDEVEPLNSTNKFEFTHGTQ